MKLNKGSVIIEILIAFIVVTLMATIVFEFKKLDYFKLKMVENYEKGL